MSRAVQFDRYGGTDVLEIREVDERMAGPGQLVVRVKATGINPGESKIRDGLLHELWPATFPSGEGSDLAGVVEQVGEGVAGFDAGDEVIGFTNTRSSHADLVVVEAADVTARPAGVAWEVAGALFVAGTTAVAMVRAVELGAGDTVVVSGAAGGVGSIAVQLAVRANATVIGLAGEGNHAWLAEHGVVPVAYGDGVADRIREAAGGRVDAFIDTFGGEYVALALALGVAPERVDTINNFAAAETHGVKIDGNAQAGRADVLAELARLVDRGELEVPIAAVYPLAEVRAAYSELEQGHTRGKIVLIP